MANDSGLQFDFLQTARNARRTGSDRDQQSRIVYGIKIVTVISDIVDVFITHVFIQRV